MGRDGNFGLEESVDGPFTPVAIGLVRVAEKGTPDIEGGRILGAGALLDALSPPFPTNDVF